MDKIERMREDVRNLKFNKETEGAMNLILDIMEDYRSENQFVKRIIEGYWHKCNEKVDPDEIPKYSKQDCIKYDPSKY